MGQFARAIYKAKYAMDGEEWPDTARRVGTEVLSSVDASPELIDATVKAITAREFLPGGRYLFAAGRSYHQTNNCFLFRPEDSREGWAEFNRKATMALMTGGGIGGWYGDIRSSGKPIKKTGGISSGPLALMEMVNEIGRHVMQGGSRRSAIWAGLPWYHNDINDFLVMKNWAPEVRAMKERDFNFPATMDMTNISVTLNDQFFAAIHDHSHGMHKLAKEVYWTTVKRMLKTGEPGFSVDTGNDWRENLRNACTEITSEDDSDVCNLGHINLARMRDLDHFRDTVALATSFCLAGTVYSDVPFLEVEETRAKNRRLGVGLMGVHEWLMQRGKPYGEDEELGTWLQAYAEITTDFAADFAVLWGLSEPVKTRAIAPTGTTGIVAETTTGLEPMFCAAYKRRYLEEGTKWKYQFVVDPTARRAVEKYNVDPEDLEDAYSLANNPERRVRFQAWVQEFVDHGISSTINLPAWGSKHNNEGIIDNFGTMLLRYLPDLRGITTYPDGARGGQPLTTIAYEEAVRHEGDIFEESSDVCDITRGSSCGD